MSPSPSPVMSTTAPYPERQRSVRSVASNSSIASGVSLTRRSRTRTRSKTVTGSVPRPTATPPPGISFPAHSNSSEPDSIPKILDTLLLPPKSANAAPSTSSRSLTSQEADSAGGEVTLVAGVPQPSSIPPKMSKAAKQASHLASIETSYNPALSAFSRDPELTPNARDSFSTQKSSTCSSFYPPSTSTISGPESPTSPQTAAEDSLQQPNISLLTEDAVEVEEMQDYDGDDVAYRLRLLVNNNYFLPPAHMKPSPQDFAASMNAKKPPKPSAPTFLDIFRVGKSKSKPNTPVAPTFNQNGPMLRTTSDSIAAPFALRSNHKPHAPHQQPPLPHNSAHPTISGNVDRGRVVVVRERMGNIAVAAKQAEQDMKTRNARRDHQGSMDRARQQQAQPITPLTPDFGDVIDPTDAVDIPLPGSNYPFAVQASALHGLGVQESVGAAILADRLPPNSPGSPGSPGMSLSYEADDWRKALLQEAVHHSLDNTPDESMFSYIPGTSTPMLATPRVNGDLSRSTTPGTRAKRLQQRIAEPQRSLEVEPEEGPSEEVGAVGTGNTTKDAIHKSEQSQASTSRSTQNFLLAPNSNDSRRSSFLPARAITPIANLTPLTPAPRKQFFNPTYSASDAELQHHQSSMDSELNSSMSPKSRLRRSMSTPLLSESWESVRQQLIMTPPPNPDTRRSSQMTQLTMHTHSYETTREMPSRASEFSSQSHFDDCEGRIVRGSPRLSALGNRMSFSSYSQGSASPTTSAFQDALNNTGEQSSTSSIRRSSLDDPTEHETHTRSSIASPPPRPSTSIAHIALRPPPRSSSFNYPLSALGRPSTAGSEPRIEISAASPTKGSHSSSSILPYASVAPEPAPIPPSFSASRRRDTTSSSTIPLSLEIPNTSVEVSIHSPAPSSPTSFFDTLQTQPNAMDDLESSDDDDTEGEEDEDEDTTDVVTRPPPSISHSAPTRPPFVVDPRARANSTVSISPVKPSTMMMRLGNFSTPYVSGRQQNERSRTLPIGVVDSKKALGYTPARAQFFSERKSDLGHGGDISTSLFVQAQAQAQSSELGPLAESPGGSNSATSSPSSVFTAPQSVFTAPHPSITEKRRPATASQVGSSSAHPHTINPVFSPSTSPLQHDHRPEALRKLDGMLVQHMEAEKDRIRKIAGAIKSSSQVNLASNLAAGSGAAGPGSPS